MRYGKIWSGFWAWCVRHSLNDSERVLAAYLVTNEHVRSLGVYRLPAAYACADLGWDPERLEDAMTALLEVRSEDGHPFLLLPGGGWVVLASYLRWDPLDNSRAGKALLKQAQALPRPVVAAAATHILREGGDRLRRFAPDLEAFFVSAFQPPEPTYAHTDIPPEWGA